VAANNGGTPLTHFGRQVRKERQARGWSLRELAARTGLAAPYLSQIENSHRPPTEKVALACDSVFPERHGWFLEYYEESKSWMPAGFRDWPEYEDKAARLSDWTPSILTGLVQTPGYAQGLLETAIGATDEVVRVRLTSRMQRQRRVLGRDDPPLSFFVIDELSLYRCVGSPEVMAAQLGHLAEVAALPNVTMQVLPAVAHPANVSGFVVTDTAALCEHMRGSFVYTEPETVTALERTFDTLRSECRKASESMALIKEMRETWATGVSPLTQTRTAATA
jgi:transcriptional regulator with XRE-family HTH domain